MSDSPWLASIVSFLDGSVSDGDSDAMVQAKLFK